MTDLEASLRQSISQYRAMQEGLFELEGLLQQVRPEAIQSFVERLSSLQSAASRFDEVVFAQLRVCSPDGPSSELLVEREHLMEKVLNQNRLLLEKIGGRISFLSSELSQVRAGRMAVSGYASGAANKGKLVRDAF